VGGNDVTEKCGGLLSGVSKPVAARAAQSSFQGVEQAEQNQKD
jgi:hypothetical protein